MQDNRNGTHIKDADEASQPRVSSKFQLDGAAYALVEGMTADEFCALRLFPGAVGVGQCEIDGKVYVVLKLSPTPDTAQELTAMLTERELEIAILIALGWPNKQIADKLHISEWTVSTHLRRIFAKLGVHNRAAMVYRCASLIDMGSCKSPLTV